MLLDIPAEQVRDALDQVAREVLAEALIAAPPVDAFAMAARLGLTVATDDDAAVRGRFVRLPNGRGGARPTILVAPEPRPERRHWAVAHEIGEWCAHRWFDALQLDPADAPPAAREAVANCLASCLLLPAQWFAADGAALDWDLVALKRRYATASHELIALRMLDMAPPIVATLWDEGRVRWRRTNAAPRTPPVTPPERDAHAAAHRLGRPAQCDRAELPPGVADVRVWPVHEKHFRREIARTELAEWDVA